MEKDWDAYRLRFERPAREEGEDEDVPSQTTLRPTVPTVPGSLNENFQSDLCAGRTVSKNKSVVYVAYILIAISVGLMGGIMWGTNCG